MIGGLQDPGAPPAAHLAADRGGVRPADRGQQRVRGTADPDGGLEPADTAGTAGALHAPPRNRHPCSASIPGTWSWPSSGRTTPATDSRLQNNAVKFMPGTRDGLMINGGGFQGKTETACDAAASFEDVWREVHHQLLPCPIPQNTAPPTKPRRRRCSPVLG